MRPNPTLATAATTLARRAPRDPVVMRARRRRVDWPIILRTCEAERPTPKLLDRGPSGRVAALLSAFDEILILEDTDAILRRVVELARENIGLTRVGILLVDRSRDLMLGTWGSDLRGAIVDEHHIMHAVSDTDREAFRRAEAEGAHYTVFDNCPIVEHHSADSAVAGSGWLAYTPILSSHGRIGMMFNDGGLFGEPHDEIKQGHAAILCSLLGVILDPTRSLPGLGVPATAESSQRRLVTGAVSMLTADPGNAGGDIAKSLGISAGRLARVFKTEMGMSLVEYRNRLLLDRFDQLLAGGKMNLLEAALAAGFGSYAQFHRVFRAFRKMTPRAYLRRR
jgi:AraC-like DNA-binding protein